MHLPWNTTNANLSIAVQRGQLPNEGAMQYSQCVAFVCHATWTGRAISLLCNTVNEWHLSGMKYNQHAPLSALLPSQCTRCVCRTTGKGQEEKKDKQSEALSAATSQIDVGSR
jgi:hypothetical protein